MHTTTAVSLVAAAVCGGLVTGAKLGAGVGDPTPGPVVAPANMPTVVDVPLMDAAGEELGVLRVNAAGRVEVSLVDGEGRMMLGPVRESAVVVRVE